MIPAAPEPPGGAARLVPGTGLSLVPPAGFAPAEAFAGFHDPAREASIGVTALPLGAEAVRERLPAGTPLTFADGRRATWHPEAVASIGGEVVRFTAVSGDDQRCIVIVATSPVEGAVELEPLFRAAAASARWEAVAPDVGDGLPFRFEEVPPMRVAARMGAVVLLTPDGALRGGVEPMMTLGHAPVEPDRPLGEVADAHLRSVPQLAQIRVTSADERVQDGVVVARLEAEAELVGGAAVQVAQWVVAAEHDQVFALAVFPAGTPDDVRHGCAGVAASIRVQRGVA